MSAKETRSSPFKRFFCKQKRKLKLLYSLEDKQVQISEEVSNLCRCTNDTYAAVSKAQREINALQESRQHGSAVDLKDEVQQLKYGNHQLEQEIKELTNAKHTLELDMCRLQIKYEKTDEIEKELAACKEKCREYEEKLMDMRKMIDQSNGAALSQRSDSHRREIEYENRIERLTVNVKSKIKEIELANADACRLKDEKIALCKLMREKDMIHEGRLRAAWLKLTEMKMERDRLRQLYQSQLNQMTAPTLPVLSMDHSVKSETETKLLQKEFQIYRRDKLIEILEERLTQYEPDFSIRADCSLSIYMDDGTFLKDKDDCCHLFSDSQSTMSCPSQDSV